MTTSGTEAINVSPLQALDSGWSILPVGLDKRPLISTWKAYQTSQPTLDEVAQWASLNPAGWAVITGAVSDRITLDFDGESGRRTMEALRLQPHRRTPSGGYHVDFKYPGWHVSTLNHKTKVELGQRWPGLDIKGDGGYAVFSGRTAKGEYVWLRTPEVYDLNILPPDLRGFLRQPKPTKPPANFAVNGSRTLPANGRVDSARLIQRAIDLVGSEGRNNAGFWLAVQLRDNGYSFGEAESAMHNYCSRVPGTNMKGEPEPYTETEMLASLREAYRTPAREPWKPSMSLVRGQPLRAVLAPRPEAEAEGCQLETEESANEIPNLLTGYDPEDVGNGQRLIAVHGENLRYCYAFDKWIYWDGWRWKIDEADCARRLTQDTMTEFALQAVKANNETLIKFAAGCRRTARITNAMREAQPHLSVTPPELDKNPDLIAFKNGYVELRTATLHAHRREDFITKLIQYDYVSDAKCPTFLDFLRRITANHSGLDAYLQKAFGYSLTGHTIEKAVFLLHGRGDNGKSTLLSTFLKLLEEYAVLLQIDTLMVRQESNNTQADLADLRGARFVMTSETEEGQRLAEGKLKRITQGMGRIKATRKYENPVEFDESHKLWLDANHLPIVRGTDDAIWNRLHPIPFDITIPKAEQDRELQKKLLAEAEGILAWAVAGAARWYREGLGKPPDVERTGQMWRAESDQIGRFIEARCVIGQGRVQARPLYLAYKQWAEDGGERAETEKKFSDRMKDRGYSTTHEEIGSIYKGLSLRVLADG